MRVNEQSNSQNVSGSSAHRSGANPPSTPLNTSTSTSATPLAGQMDALALTEKFNAQALQSSLQGFKPVLENGTGAYFSAHLKDIDATLNAVDEMVKEGSDSAQMLGKSFFVKEDAAYLREIKKVMVESANLEAKASTTHQKGDVPANIAQTFKSGDDQSNRMEQYRTPNKPLEHQRPLSSEAIGLMDKDLERTHKILQYKLNTIERMSAHEGDADSIKKVLKNKGLLKGEAYTESVRPRLEAKNIMLLPPGAPLAGSFPKEDHLTLSAGENSNNFARLVEHADGLLNKYDFASTDSKQRILPNKTGCVCIMYAKETDNAGNTTYVPFFGASGTAKSKDDMVESLALPPLYTNDQLDDYKDLKGKGQPLGETMQKRFFDIFERHQKREHLGLKHPSLQATISEMTYESDVRRNQPGTWADSAYAGGKPDIRRHSSQIESWNSLHCAEPAAIVAAANLYPRMADMDLSIPYEATKPDQRNIDTLGKHTCGRCAISEVRFAAYAADNQRVEVPMYSVLLGDQNTLENELSFKNMISDHRLLHNKFGSQVYEPKLDDMEPTLQAMKNLGIHHSSDSPIAKEAGAMPGLVKPSEIPPRPNSH